jgi:hypothetical protein
MLHTKHNFGSWVMRVSFPLFVCVLLILVLGTIADGQTQKSKAKGANAFAAVEVQQPVYREYRGVRLGMTMEEARAKLGQATLKGDDQDIYVFSENETAQIAYNTAHKVVTISTDYLGGVGAPDYQTVVGADIAVRPDGSMYKTVYFRSEGCWVGYNKSAGPVPTVSITLQLLAK